MCKRLQTLLRSNDGQAMSEYGLVLAIVAVALIGGIVAFRQELAAMFTSLTNSMKNQTPSP